MFGQNRLILGNVRILAVLFFLYSNAFGGEILTLAVNRGKTLQEFSNLYQLYYQDKQDVERSLRMAGYHGRNDIINFLVIEKNISKDAKSKTDRTALFFAVKNNHLDTVKLLCRFRANTALPTERAIVELLLTHENKDGAKKMFLELYHQFTEIQKKMIVIRLVEV